MSASSLPRSLLLFSLGILLGGTATCLIARCKNDDALKEDITDGVENMIGNTKLIKIRSLSRLTGCEILAKAEVPSHTQREQAHVDVVSQSWWITKRSRCSCNPHFSGGQAG